MAARVKECGGIPQLFPGVSLPCPAFSRTKEAAEEDVVQLGGGCRRGQGNKHGWKDKHSWQLREELWDTKNP